MARESIAGDTVQEKRGGVRGDFFHSSKLGAAMAVAYMVESIDVSMLSKVVEDLESMVGSSVGGEASVKGGGR